MRFRRPTWRASLRPGVVVAMLFALTGGVEPVNAQPSAAPRLSPDVVRSAPEPSSDLFQLGRLKYGGGGDWYSNPTSLPNLLRELGRRTNVRVAPREVNVNLLDESLYKTPFLYMNGHGTVRFTEAEAERLRTFLAEGGFLWADDNYGMDRSFRAAMKQVFPDKELVELPFDHPIFHAFYEMPKGVPKVHEHDGLPAQGLGLFDGGRLVVFYTYQSDIGDGIENPEVHNDPPGIREDAMKMAVNVVLYDMMN